MWKKWSTCIIVVVMAYLLNKNLTGPQEVKYSIIMYPAIPLLGLSPKNCRQVFRQIHVHTRSQHRCLKQPKGGSNPNVCQHIIGKQSVVYICNAMLFSHKKEGGSGEYYNVE